MVSLDSVQASMMARSGEPPAPVAGGLPAPVKSSSSVKEGLLASQELMQTAAKIFSDYLRSNNSSLTFEPVTGSAGYVLRVSDSQTGQVIRQVPSDEVLRLMRYFHARGSVMVDQSA